MIKVWTKEAPTHRVVRRESGQGGNVLCLASPYHQKPSCLAVRIDTAKLYQHRAIRIGPGTEKFGMDERHDLGTLGHRRPMVAFLHDQPP